MGVWYDYPGWFGWDGVFCFDFHFVTIDKSFG